NSSAHRCQLQIAARPLPAYAAFPQTRQGTLQQQSPRESSRFSSTLVLDALRAYTPCPATVVPCSRVIISFSFKQSQPEELMTCPSFRITVWIVLIAAHEMWGFSQRKNGTIKRDVCCADIRSVEPTKITPSQITSGSQYLRKDFIPNVRGKSGISRSKRRTSN